MTSTSKEKPKLVLQEEAITGEVNVDSFIQRQANTPAPNGEEEGYKEAGEDEKLLPEGMEMTDLDKNIYSLIFTGGVTGPGFWFGIVICAFQAGLIALALKDTLDFDNENNPLGIPAGNDFTVTVAQVALFFILPQLADDMMEGLEFLIDGYHPEVLEMCPDATMWSWALSGFLHFANGAVMIYLVFVLLMQQTSVISLGLKYCAFGFFAKIDNVAFTIAKKGVCSVPLQKEIKACGKVQIRKHTEYTWSRRIRDTLLFAGLLTGWGVLTYQQINGKFLCDQLFVQMGDIFNPDIVEMSGMFDMLDIKEKVAGRAVYLDRELHSIRLAYCEDLTQWTMTRADDNGNWDECTDPIATSGKDTGYSILQTKDTWSVERPLLKGFKLFTFFQMECNECSSKCKAGTCDEHNHCVCQPDNFGVNCEFASPCNHITLNQHTAPFPKRELGLLRFPTEYEMLTLDDGSKGAHSHFGTFQVEYRPVFYGVDEDWGDNYLLFFAGRRWVIVQANVDGVALDNRTAVVDYMSDPTKFNTITSTYEPFFASAPMDRGTPTNQDTPEHLSWFRTRSNGYNDDVVVGYWWEPATDEPVEAVLHCAFCDRLSNPCENGGQCMSSSSNKETSLAFVGTCQCYPGTAGSLCEKDIQCTDPDPNNETNTIGCEQGGMCTETGKCTKCPIGFLGSTCQIAVPCSELAQFVEGPTKNWNGCFRGGTCNTSAWLGGCTCPEGFSGPHCQFPNATELEDWLWPFK